MNATFKKSAYALALTGLLFAAGSASAEVPAAVTSAASTLTTDGVSAISAVGAAMLTMAGVAVLFKWVKATFFG
jgi:hypothetical protein